VYILGLSALEHDSAAALLSDKGIEAAVEESKLTRVVASGGIPRAAIRFCLERAGIEWRDVDYLAVASRPWRAWAREFGFRVGRTPLAPVASLYSQTKALGKLGRDLNNLRILNSINEGPVGEARKQAGEPSRLQTLSLDHHLCHAASAFYASPFDRALVLTLDEFGDGWSGAVALGEGRQIRVLRSVAFPHSLGWVYSQVTALLGFLPHQEEHKTQWLSLEGEPVFQDLFGEVVGGNSRLLPSLDLTYFNRGRVGRVAFSEKFYRRLGSRPGRFFEPDAALRRNLACSLQWACARSINDCVEKLLDETKTRQVCVAGGVFLNSLLVAELEKRVGLEGVFAQPASGNAGCALGAAWLVWHQTLNKPRQEALSSLNWGPSFSSDQIKEVLDNCKVCYRWHDTQSARIREAVRVLDRGEILAWYQGAAEFGPRALGHRSLLASPWAAYVKENLNSYVKHREPFRPFALAVPEEECGRYFDCSRLVRFMATVGWVRPEARELVKGVALPGDRIRLYAVSREADELLWQLLKEFGKRAPAPFLINTSFNLFGEPLVITPRDAIRSFYCSGIDALAIDGFFVDKTPEVGLEAN
jgi:carbamoyltransferase